MYTHSLKKQKNKNLKTYSRKESKRPFLQFSTLNKENPRFKVLKISPHITRKKKTQRSTNSFPGQDPDRKCRVVISFEDAGIFVSSIRQPPKPQGFPYASVPTQTHPSYGPRGSPQCQKTADIYRLAETTRTLSRWNVRAESSQAQQASSGLVKKIKNKKNTFSEGFLQSEQ